MADKMSRRNFIAAATAATAAASMGGNLAHAADSNKPALLGGSKAMNTPFPPSWPVVDDSDEQAILKVFRSKKWFRGYGQTVDQFEQEYASLCGAKHCIATANGTSALMASLNGLGVGPGDEVILPPYTFIATLNVILLQYALPIFVDSDPKTFQIDARKIESAITDRTTAIIPVHIGGSVADLDTILSVAKAKNVPVIEDACQTHLGEWRGKKVGSLGTTGCFSFQASKNLNSGEGGAILTSDAELAQRCYAFHNNCRGRNIAGYNFAYMGTKGANLRMTEFQAGLLLSQMKKIDQQARVRTRNAEYLTKMLKEIPGIEPAEMYEGCTRNAYHLYMFRYHKERFSEMPRAKFMQAMGAEGIGCSAGYSPLNKEAFLKTCLASKAYKRIYGERLLGEWAERNQCPENDRLCQEAVWLTQNMLLGPRSDMEKIVEAVHKISASAGVIARA